MRTKILAETLVSTLREQAADREMIALSCECHDSNFTVEDIAYEAAVDEVVVLLEHAMFDHTGRNGILVHRSYHLLEGFRIGQIGDLPALTEYEEKWRAENPL